MDAKTPRQPFGNLFADGPLAAQNLRDSALRRNICQILLLESFSIGHGRIQRWRLKPRLWAFRHKPAFAG